MQSKLDVCYARKHASMSDPALIDACDAFHFRPTATTVLAPANATLLRRDNRIEFALEPLLLSFVVVSGLAKRQRFRVDVFLSGKANSIQASMSGRSRRKFQVTPHRSFSLLRHPVRLQLQ